MSAQGVLRDGMVNDRLIEMDRNHDRDSQEEAQRLVDQR